MPSSSRRSDSSSSGPVGQISPQGLVEVVRRGGEERRDLRRRHVAVIQVGADRAEQAGQEVGPVGAGRRERRLDGASGDEVAGQPLVLLLAR